MRGDRGVEAVGPTACTGSVSTAAQDLEEAGHASAYLGPRKDSIGGWRLATFQLCGFYCLFVYVFHAGLELLAEGSYALAIRSNEEGSIRTCV